MTNRDIVIALVSSVIAGLAVWIIQQAYTNRREKKREAASKTVKSLNDDKMVSDDIFGKLAPGRSIELMKHMLGVPDIFRRSDTPIFKDRAEFGTDSDDEPDPDTIDTHSYIYMFKNAHVKITSRDNESIDSLTVIGEDKSLSADSLLIPDGIESANFANLKVWSELVDSVSYHKYVRTMKESFFALDAPTGPPMHQHVTFFGFPRDEYYEESNDLKRLLGAQIEGVCISANLADVYYIYEYEYR